MSKVGLKADKNGVSWHDSVQSSVVIRTEPWTELDQKFELCSGPFRSKFRVDFGPMFGRGTTEWTTECPTEPLTEFKQFFVFANVFATSFPLVSSLILWWILGDLFKEIHEVYNLFSKANCLYLVLLLFLPLSGSLWPKFANEPNLGAADRGGSLHLMVSELGFEIYVDSVCYVPTWLWSCCCLKILWRLDFYFCQ